MATTQPTREYANDGSYESVRRQLHKLAFRCFARVQAMGLGMTYEDVLQEMNLTYVRALKTWNPQGGSRFLTYLTTACINNFNDRIRKPELERRELGMVNMTDMRRVGNEDDDELDPMELFDAREAQTLTVDVTFFGDFDNPGSTQAGAQALAPLHANPEQVLESRQVAREGMRQLTDRSRALVVELIRAAHAGEDLPRLSELAERRGISATELRRIRAEITQAFGVKV